MEWNTIGTILVETQKCILNASKVASVSWYEGQFFLNEGWNWSEIKAH